MRKHKLDYSDYQQSENEKFRATHRGNADIQFEFFLNSVVERREERSLVIEVDDYFEWDNINRLIAEREGRDEKEYLEAVLQDLLKEDPQYYENQKEKFAENLALYKKYQQNFSITSHAYDDAPDETQPLINPFSGARITIPLGVGILNFCYADFRGTFEKNRNYLSAMNADAMNDLGRLLGKDAPDAHPLKIQNREDENDYLFECYNNAMLMLSDILYSSLYTTIFPPVLLQASLKAYNCYYTYLVQLQAEMLELIEFCFDADFYPEVLGNLYPSERYYLYNTIKKRGTCFERKEIFSVNLRSMSGDTMPFGMEQDELVKRITAPVSVMTEEHKAFAKQYSISEQNLKGRLHFPTFIYTTYECRSVFEMLYMEFTKMLEHKYLFKKCKNCGQYFILKDNSQTEYCDRIPPGETQNCQTIASHQNKL